MRRLLTCLAGFLSLGLVAPAMVADGHQAARIAAAPRSLAPAITIERLPARAADGTVLGTIVAPALIDPAGAADRPVLVVFNGGPGAASGWLQLGLLGPWRAAVPDDPKQSLGGPIPLVPNRDGVWDKADILFIDPLGTGFSRPAPGADPAEIRDWRKDGDYIAGAVRDWLARRGREDVPLILMGESYGAERAVAVADALLGQPRPVRLAGLALLSQTITTDLSLQHRDPGLASAIALPTIAATACYLGTSDLAADPAACAARSDAFAQQGYRRALAAGSDRAGAIAELARVTGLPAAHFAAAGLAVSRSDYRRLALQPAGLVLGMYDSRYSARATPGRAWQDPSLDPLLPAMQDAAERYGRTVLGLDGSPLDGTPYVLFNPELHATWRYAGHVDPYRTIDIPGLLKRVLARSGARLLVAGGMFDTVGSYGADRYLVRQLALAPSRVTLRSYPAGHMFYLDGASRRAFLPVLRDFVGRRT